ncbi:MAG: type B DNA-directed DNA polymerase [Methanoregulaceae archaeon]|nr:type B DNA-directed DNA polymerase [Methanoregulaceae archaeon]
MWILDTCYRDGRVEIWDRDGGLKHISVPYEPSFLLHLPDPHAHWEMIEALGTRYRVEECTFRTVYGEREGYRVAAGREVAEAVERESRFSAQLYNVDLRLDQRYLAEQELFPCGNPDEYRLSPRFALPERVMEVAVRDNPFTHTGCSRIVVTHEREEEISGAEHEVLADLAGLVQACDPDVILFPSADVWMPRIRQAARRYGIDLAISRSGRFRRLDAKSYWSYGRTEYREGSLIPDGRVLIDTRGSFNYREGRLAGVVLASRLTGLSPNLAARFTAGTLISTYEVYEAIRRGVAVPFRKSDAEAVRRFGDLRAADRGGMMFQPLPGLYEGVTEIDYTSLYPSIIVQSNLSPETISRPGVEGFLPAVLDPLLNLRRETKQLKKTEPAFAGIDSILKWMLVTCFGYTGYRNAKFGRIEVHEAITSGAREILLRTRDIAEEMGFPVIHGIVDCLFVRGGPVEALKERVEREIGLPTELEAFSWIVFLPMPDGFGAYNRYYGRLSDGGCKVRGIAARRGDTPAYVRHAQERMLDVMGTAATLDELAATGETVIALYRDAIEGLRKADPREMAIRRQVGRLEYTRSCPEASAVRACRESGVEVSPGMEIAYVVQDARTWTVELEWRAAGFDAAYYRTLLDRAWTEIDFCFRELERPTPADVPVPETRQPVPADYCEN